MSASFPLYRHTSPASAVSTTSSIVASRMPNWAEMRKSTSFFTFKGCTEMARLVGEVEDLRKMMESLKRMVTGQGLEEKRGETGDQEASLEEAEEKEKEKSVGEKTRENSSTDNKDGKRIRPEELR